ncbi:MAG: ABC transporter ATP-binding protein [Bacteroidetes bacterium]|mgnify:FL=1|nr:ABC transporter ATP-binding protein [Bacteroidota bacterium]MBT5426485.1 ABC transporter ATP-binding protein [Bacteroidota bacterium]MBT7462835.1 ABC transporter ATP-binding protein [Bacteroidota bacterium]
MNLALSCTALSKKFGEISALQNINIDVERGELFGVIGPDGGGKTTLFRILATLLIPDDGDAQVLGFDSIKDYLSIRKRIGYMPGRFSLYHDLTVKENLQFYSSVFKVDIEKNYGMIASVYDQLKPFANRRAGKLSGGMKQKLALSCALIHKPELLILDEPTTGVDAVSRIEFWNTLDSLKEDGMTILVSTPYMDEANRCDRIAMIQKGELLYVDSPKSLIDNYSEPLFAASSLDRFVLLNRLEQVPWIDLVYLCGQEVHFVLRDVKHDKLLEYFKKNEWGDVTISQIQPTVEDCFISLMKTR